MLRFATETEYWPVCAAPPAARELRASVPPPPNTDHPVRLPLSRSALPTRFGVVTQIPALQNAPGTHALSAVQLVPHAAAAQRKPLQLRGVLSTQAPAPLQMRDGTTAVLSALHAAVASHTRPAAWTRQAPAPLQTPVVPHVDTGCGVHSSRGSSPLSAGTHLPLVAPLHVMHVPVHAWSQQTLSAQ